MIDVFSLFVRLFLIHKISSMVLNIAAFTGRRVVVTGMGLYTSLGHDTQSVWSKLINGECSIKPITSFDAQELCCRIAAPIDEEPDVSQFDAQIQKLDRFIRIGMVAAEEAMNSSGLPRYFEQLRKDSESTKCTKKYKVPYDELLRSSGTIIGSGIGGLSAIERTVLEMKARSDMNAEAGRIQNPLRNPFFIVGCLTNMLSGVVSQRHKLMGPNQSAVTACATGAHAISDAARMIATGEANVMVAGGSESCIVKAAVAGFDVMKALSRRNDDPKKASCPWNKTRDGFVMGEGAGILVLEEYEHAMSRGAKIYAEIIGSGSSGDAYHMSAPHPDGDGGMRAMHLAIKHAGIKPEEIDYVNAHGTSTPLGDIIELRAIYKLFKGDKDLLKNLSISSTKSAIGHLLGAAGAVEAIFSILAMNTGEVPPTLNLDDPDDFTTSDSNEVLGKVTDIFNLTPNISQKKDIKIAISNSFGFGGTNSSMLFRKV